MNNYAGKIIEIKLSEDGYLCALIQFDAKISFMPGQYYLTYDPIDPNPPLSIPLFPRNKNPNSAWFSPIPDTWLPGKTVTVKGPFGNGFQIPKDAKNISLVSLGNSIWRLLSLIEQSHYEAALFADIGVKNLSKKIELNPLSAFYEDKTWGDFLVIDCHIEKLPNLINTIKGGNRQPLSQEIQIFIESPIPCGGSGDCGVCSFQISPGNWLYACLDGPVFKLVINNNEWEIKKL